MTLIFASVAYLRHFTMFYKKSQLLENRFFMQKKLIQKPDSLANSVLTEERAALKIVEEIVQ